jgi:hypothetical protein
VIDLPSFQSGEVGDGPRSEQQIVSKFFVRLFGGDFAGENLPELLLGAYQHAPRSTACAIHGTVSGFYVFTGYRQ